MNSFRERANLLWDVADKVLRDDFKRSKYSDVILPFTVLRRVDCVIAPTKDKVRKRYEDLTAKGLKNLDGQLRKASGYSFYNTAAYDFPKLLNDPKNIGKNLIAYLNGFSENMREVFDKFKLRNTIDTLNQKGLTYMLVEKFAAVDLHPLRVTNHEMGTIFEELIRRFNEQTNENPGEHFTPREVIRLMVKLLINGDKKILKQQAVIRTVFDPACGTGGMLSIAKEYIQAEINPQADIRLFGQEINDETYAVCKSDMYLKGDDRDADNIKPDSCLMHDGHTSATFDYMLSNPPYGKDWNKEKKFIEDEAARGEMGRFGAGLPRSSDGQLLFLLHMISKMKPPGEGGSRVAIIMNGSPLFTGDAASGESEIRRRILEDDLLEVIVAMPGQLFYNTGINTYVWILTNRKIKERRGRVLLVNGAATRREGEDTVDVFARKMRKSLGDKRNELSEDTIAELARLAHAFEEGPYVKDFRTTDFGFRKITIERPLRLNFQASPERIERVQQHKSFQNLATSKKKDKAAREREIEAGRETQRSILLALDELDSNRIWKNREAFRKCLYDCLIGVGLKVSSAFWKVLLSELSERDEAADVCMDAKGNPEPDSELRDYESVPLGEDIYEYFDREVRPHVPDAWINESVRDHKDDQIGKVGYEINFNRYFYEYQSPRPLEEIEAEIETIEGEILRMLGEVAR